MYRARERSRSARTRRQYADPFGLVAGERVVNRANFLLDSESRLMESMGAMPGMNH
jgi:hypothetical protein